MYILGYWHVGLEYISFYKFYTGFTSLYNQFCWIFMYDLYVQEWGAAANIIYKEW